MPGTGTPPKRKRGWRRGTYSFGSGIGWMPKPPKPVRPKIEFWSPSQKIANKKAGENLRGIKNNLNAAYSKLTGQPGAKILPRPKRPKPKTRKGAPRRKARNRR